MNALDAYAQRNEVAENVCHEARGPAEIELAIEAGQQLVDHSPSDATLAVEIPAWNVLRPRSTVGDVDRDVPIISGQLPDFRRQWMVGAIPGAVYEDHRLIGAALMQHADHGRDADTGADQHCWAVGAVEDETSGRRPALDQITLPQPVMEQA